MGHLWHGATETGVRVGQDATHCATPTSTLHAREPKQTSAPGTESRYRTGTWSEAVVGSLPDAEMQALRLWRTPSNEWNKLNVLNTRDITYRPQHAAKCHTVPI
ncbi:hypothetical protein H113_07613 [Trichophyton rubrum MR1459]|nr:hypothetical protein H113_07613 [Trichophyton rubrum MR1459]EZG02547.1 hypothetical protein H106_07389 [Trichophyton rubrum CBS 735.88]